ncbi:MAG: chemotaxis protein CheW [Gammaproteobacteria bacterium]|nr:chemotaxis protein CheW [Gammaproteobacteria bacterium]
MSSAYAKQEHDMQPGEAPKQGLEVGDDLLFDLESALEEDQGLQRHTVLVGDIGLVLPVDEVSELIEKVAVCQLPNTQAWFNGVTSIRGNMIPVFDLHELFSIEPPTASRRLIVVGQNETAAAFWVDDFPRLLVFAEEEITTNEPSIPSLLRKHARQYFLQDGKTWVEWDFKSFFATLGEQL